MDLRQLEFFAAVARHGHFGRAAQELYVTQPAVSQQIRRLETELGVGLLRRTSRGVHVTPAGEELLVRAQAILADVAAARAAMEEHAGVQRGGVRLAVTPGEALRLAPALAAFAREHPGLRVTLRQVAPTSIAALVASGSVDLAVAGLSATPDGERVRAEPLAAARLAVALAPDDPAAGRRLALWELRERPFVLPEPGTPLRETVAAAFAAAGFSPVPLLEAGDAATLRALVHEGLGVALAPAAWLAGEGPAVGVAALRETVEQPVWLLRPAAALAPAAGLAEGHLRASLGGPA